MAAAQTSLVEKDVGEVTAFPWKLWIYTNYDCNLRCRYCVARSSPNAPRRAIGLANVQRLVDEAAQLGFVQTFFTGGEPFLLPDIYDMLAYASARVQTTVLTNAMLLHGSRLEKLVAVANDRLIVQVSLDGGGAGGHPALPGGGPGGTTMPTAVTARGRARWTAFGSCRRMGSVFAWARPRRQLIPPT